MGMMAVVLAVSLLPQSAPVDGARQAVRAAISAVEGDSVDAADRRWRSRPADRHAVLGRAILARLTYRHGLADSLAVSLLGGPDDAAALRARLQLAVDVALRTDWRRGDSLFADAAKRANAFGDIAAEVEALLSRSLTAIRVAGIDTSLALVTRAESIRPLSDRALAIRTQCTRATIDATRGLTHARLAADSGAAGAREIGDRRLEASCEHVVARSLEQLGYLDSAIMHLGRVERLQRATRDRAALAATLQWRGWSHVNRGDYDAARRDLLEAIAEGESTGNHSPVAWAHLQLSFLALALGDVITAAQESDTAESLLREHNDAWGLVAVLGVRLRVARRTGDVMRMRTAAEAYRGGTESLGGTWRLDALRSLAFAEETAGDLHGAKLYLDSAMTFAVAQRMQGSIWNVEEDLARIELATGDAAGARRRLERIVKELGDRQPAFRFASRINLAAAELALGDAAGAESTVRAAFDSLEAWRDGLSDRAVRRAVFSLSDDRPAERDLPAVLAGLVRAGRSEVAFEFAERRRARLLLEQIALIADATADETGAHPDIASLPLVEVRRALPDGATALLEFATGQPGTPVTAFLVTRDAVRATVLAPLDSLADDIARMHALLESGGDVAAPARSLGNALLDRILKDMPASITRLVIVPDRGLHGISWDVLAPGGTAILDRFVTSVAPSASVFARLVTRPRDSGPVRVLAMGDPRVADLADGPAATAVIRAAFEASGGVAPLPASTREARRVRRRAADGTVLVRAHATEAALKREHAGYGLLHLAAHAVVDDRSPARTALALAPGDGEDGFLTPGELAALDLDAELFVLSACRTARGPVAGSEGVQGFATAALEAGARSVLASQASVGDVAAATFMDAFYGGLAVGLDAGNALAEARRSLRARGVPPRDWAAFALVGDPFVTLQLVEPARTIPIRYVAVALVATLIATVIYGVMRRARRAELAREPSARTASTRH